MTDKPAKFASLFANHFTDFGKMKPFFGKPYMMTGTLFGSLSFMFQTGCILGRHFRERAEPFFLAFSVEEGHERRPGVHHLTDAARRSAFRGIGGVLQ